MSHPPRLPSIFLILILLSTTFIIPFVFAAIEDLTEYTEVDSADEITVTPEKVEWETMRRDAESWLVYDFGAAYFGDFHVNCTLDFSGIEAGDGSSRDIMAVCMLSNTNGTFADVIGGDLIVIFPRQVSGTDDSYFYVLRQYDGGVNNLEVIDTTTYTMTPHYLTLERVGDVITLRVYNDSARTTLLENLNGTGVTDTYRYFHAIASYDSPTGDPDDHSTGYVENINFGLAEEYEREATQAIGVGLATSRLAEFYRATSQSIGVGLATSRLAEFYRATSQSIGVGLATSRLAEFYRATSQSIGVGLATSRLAEFYRATSQSIGVGLATSRLAEFYRATSQSIGIALEAVGLTGFYRTAAQAIGVAVEGTRLAELSRAVTQALGWRSEVTGVPPSDAEGDVTTYIGGQGIAGVIIFCAVVLIPLVLGLMKK